METYGIQGAIAEDNVKRLRHHVVSLLESAIPSPPSLSRAIGVACGGNAEALVRLAPGPFVGKSPTVNVRLLRDQTWRLLRLDVAGRMRVFRVRKDRAEVMGIAAIIITTVAKWLGLRSMLVPGVGVREGCCSIWLPNSTRRAWARMRKRGAPPRLWKARTGLRGG